MPFNPGFNKSEAEPLIALLSNLEGAPSPPFQQLALPIGWRILFDSQSIGPFNNRWQLAQSPAVTFSGSIISRCITTCCKGFRYPQRANLKRFPMAGNSVRR
jgi:hypothetical protein